MADVALARPSRVPIPTLMDVAERTVLTLLFARLVMRNWAIIWTPGHWFNILLIVSEGMAALLLLVRRKSDKVSPRFSDWLFAFFATAGPLLVQPGGGASLIPQWLGAALLIGGLATQMSAKVVLGRSFGIVPANRGVKASGPYRVVRHPMYLGYISVQVGYLLLAPNGWNLLIYGLSFTVQIFRILAEERLLARDPAYRAFQAHTRWRLVPGVF